MAFAEAISNEIDDFTRDEPAPFDDDDPFDLPPPLPPLSPHRDEDRMNQNGDALVGDQPDEGEGGKKESNTKRKIKRSPRPKLDEIRLCGDRGLPALTHLCDGIKFKGKGHEASDLKLLLQRYEYWAHRLFPKFPFADVVDQVEKLGSKKLVQNCIKRVRRGEDDIIDDGEKSETELDAQDGVSRDDRTQSQVPATPVSNIVQPFGVQAEPRNGMVILTPEQQERIRLNRERALTKRKAAQENQIAQENTPINEQTTIIEEPAKSIDVLETVKDVDSGAGSVGVEHDSSVQENDVEMFDDHVDIPVDIPLPDGGNSESADGAGMSISMAWENENMREEDTEMENAETTTYIENSNDIAQNGENLPTVQDVVVSEITKENDLSIFANKGNADSGSTFCEDEMPSSSREEGIQQKGAQETSETGPSEQAPTDAEVEPKS